MTIVMQPTANVDPANQFGSFEESLGVLLFDDDLNGSFQEHANNYGMGFFGLELQIQE